jgi:hypothetical protein
VIFHPSVIALLSGSLLNTVLFAYAAVFAWKIMRSWDLASGSELQVSLERRTYLISAIIAICLVFQVISLFLFIHTTDSLCTLFPGAMCAAGTLNLNHFGYPVLLLKLVNALIAGIWLIVNHADSRGYDYPLIRVKYRMLLAMLPFVVAESLLMALYFFSLHPQVITSCCGSLFSSVSGNRAPLISMIPIIPLLAAMFAAMTASVLLGARYLRQDSGGYLFTASSAVSLVLGAVSLVISIPVYVYAMPAHHCPFCMLHREYHFVGYLFYAALLGGGVTGLGVGALQPFRRGESLASALPAIQRRLVIAAMVLYSLFAVAAACQVLLSDLRIGS